jgi:hypothetical protein
MERGVSHINSSRQECLTGLQTRRRVSGRLPDAHTGFWEVHRRGKGYLEGYQMQINRYLKGHQSRRRVSGRLTDAENGVWKVSRRGQRCLEE